MRRKVVPLLVLVLVLAACFAMARGLRRPDGALVLSGNVEYTEVRLGFRLGGVVSERLADEGSRVAAGQAVARLDDAEVRREVAQAEAALAVTRAALAELEAGSRPEEVAQARAALARVRAEAARLESEARRQRELLAKAATTEAAAEAATAARDAGLALVEETAQRLALVEKGPRREQLDQARGRVRQAEEALALARLHLEWTTLASPLAGTVLSVSAEPGERVAPGATVLAVADTARAWLRAWVEEPDLWRVKPGQEVAVRVDGAPGRSWAGRVASVSPEAEFTPRQVQTAGERVRLVYRVRIDVPNPDGALKAGMPADASFPAAPKP